jgi:hypothetical protein
MESWHERRETIPDLQTPAAEPRPAFLLALYGGVGVFVYLYTLRRCLATIYCLIE